MWRFPVPTGRHQLPHSSSGTSRSRNVSSWNACKERHIGNYFPIYAALCPSRFESSQTLLSEPQIEHCRSQLVASDIWLHAQYVLEFKLRISDIRSVDSSTLQCEGMQYCTEVCSLFVGRKNSQKYTLYVVKH